MDEPDFGHLATPLISQGPYTGALENFNAHVDRQFHVDSALGAQDMLQGMYDRNIQKIKDLTGQDLSLPAPGGSPLRPLSWTQVAIRRRAGMSPGSIFTPQDQTDGILASIDANEKKIAEIKKNNPDVKTLDELFSDMIKARDDITRRSDQDGATTGWGGMAAGLAGSIVGSFTPNDPFTVGTMFMGGFGKTLAMRMLTEAGTQAGIEAVNQFGIVQPTREMLGEAPGNPWENVMYAALGGAAFRGAGELAHAGAGKGFRALEDRIAPQRKFARAFEEGMGLPEPGQMESYLSRLQDTPTKRALVHLYDNSEAVRIGNLYGMSRAGIARAEAETMDLVNGYDGRPATATDVFRNMDGPVLMQDLAYEQAVVRQENPQLMEQYDRASTLHGAAEDRVSAIENELGQRTVGDAVGLVDEPSGLRVKAIEQELEQQTIPPERRAALEDELDSVVKGLGEDAIAKAENDYRIAPKKQLAVARRAAKQARQEFAQVTRQVMSEADGVKARNAAAARVDDILNVLHRTDDPLVARDPQWAPKPADAVAHAEAQHVANEAIPDVADKIASRNMPPEPPKNKVVGAPAKSSTGLTEGLAGAGKAIGDNFYDGWFKLLSREDGASSAFRAEARYKETRAAYDAGKIKSSADLKTFLTAPTETMKPGVDVGLAKNVPDATPVITIDSQGRVVASSARKVMDDIIASENMLEAMKVCSI